jgi:hypothetical protein
MPGATVRIHVVMPTNLVASIDQIVGRRRRSQFLVEAAAEKLARLQLAQLVEDAAGSLADVDIPGWETSESAAEWCTRAAARTMLVCHRMWTDPDSQAGGFRSDLALA